MSENEPLSSLIKNLDMCRLCLNITGNKINIFTDDFPKMLEILTGIKVSKDDNLPKISCLKCALEVKTAILIRRKIIKSYRALQSQKNIDILKSESFEVRKKPLQPQDIDCHDDFDNPSSLDSHPIELGENSNTLKEIENLKNFEMDADKKVEKIQEIKFATNSQYLKKLRSFDLKKTTAPSQRDSHDFEDEVKINISNERPSPPRSPVKVIQISKVPMSMHRRKLLERKRTMRQEIAKMMEKKRKVKIDIKELSDNDDEEERKKPPKKAYYCAECKIKFPKYGLYWNHMAKHSHKKCHLCDKVVQTVYFKKHMLIHTGGEVVCEICGFTSKNAGSLRMHYAYHHRGPKPLCDECGKTFLSKTKLMYHRKKYHMMQKDFKCETCGKEFHLKVYLDKHISVKHMKIRPHICEFCGRGFASRHGLKTHRRQHTNEAPYECHLCYERFRQKVSLRSHLKSKHQIEEEENYFCSVCGKGYASDMALEIHTRIHNEVKCPHCTDTFANNEYLDLHLHSVHKPASDHEEGTLWTRK